MNASFKTTPLRLVKIGNSAGVVLPKELLGRLGVQPGDTLNATITDDGIELRRSEEEFATQIAAAREVMTRRVQALRELAK